MTRLLVAQDVKRKDWMQRPDAKAAVDAEWKRLRDKRTWREPESPQQVQFLDEVVRKAKATGVKIHLGRLFDICVLKAASCPRATRTENGKVG